MVRLLKTNGEIVENFIAETLKEKQDAVGGYIELVRLHDGSFLVVNEEGLMKQLAHNKDIQRSIRVLQDFSDTITSSKQ